MSYKYSKVSKPSPLSSILPKLRLSLALLVWVPIAEAQLSNFDTASGEISGIVLIQADNRPASQVLVNLRSGSAGISRNVLTDLDGRFEIRGLPTDTYEIMVEEPGYEPSRTTAQLSGRSSELVVYLRSSQSAQRGGNSSMVSVRELKISGKAREEYQKGMQLLEKKDPAGSLGHFTKAAQAFPGFYEAFYNKGVAEMRLGHRDEAMEAYQAAIDMSGGRFAWAQFAVGYLLCEEGRPVEAEKIIRRGLEVEESSPEGYVLLGSTLMELKRWDEAERSLQEALIRDPDFADAYLVHSNISARKGNYLVRLQDLEAYLRLKPTGPASKSVRQAREATLKILAEQHPQN
jgi:tetratricopeptide (TPR) repeat protein